jgi:putative radical SAM enzyme (TIGR03279 family)
MDKDYVMEKGHLIDYVSPGSPAAKAGIKAGWRLMRLGSQKIGDIIDFKILEADYRLNLLLKTDSGKLVRKNITKKPETSLGLRFDPITIDQLKLCPNRCIFCFIDQNPAGLRKTLYVKDDDYRLSFLYGNFITLNRLTAEEMKRIISLQLSPLYISLHTTNPQLRSEMFGSKLAVKGLDNFYALNKAGIKMHVQIVLCPGINTGKELDKTIKDLNLLGNSLLSVALVPVGLTAYRQGLYAIQKVSAAEASNLIKEIGLRQKHFLRTRKSRFLFLADEFYNIAGMSYPDDDYYEDYPQLENGVGLARQFLNQLADLKQRLLPAAGTGFKLTIVSGIAAATLLSALKDKLSGIEGLSIDLVSVENHFFGKDVTVSGLLTGSDLLSSLEKREQGDLVVIANNLLRDAEDLFLDNLSLSELEAKLGVPIKAVEGPLDLLNELDMALRNKDENIKIRGDKLE